MFASRRWQLLISAVIFMIGIFLIPTQVALAATLTVDGTCTLEDAITAANTDAAVGGCIAGAGADTLILDANVNLTAGVGTNVDGGQSGTPDITSVITIQAGDASIISGNGTTFRIFNVTATGDLTLEDVVVQNGRIAPGTAVNAYGGGIHVAGGTLNLINSIVTNNTVSQPTIARTVGGGIYNAGTLSIVNSTISNNQALGPANGAGGTAPASTFGGGIYNADVGVITTIEYSTIDRNIARGGTGGTAGYALGGGIFTAGNINNITNSTISNNSAESIGTGTQRSFGGGINILNHTGGTPPVIRTFQNNTLSGNSAIDEGGGMEVTVTTSDPLVIINTTLINNTAGTGGAIAPRSGSNTVILQNSIVVASGSTTDCFGGVTDGGNNLRDSASDCGAGMGTITIGTDIDAALDDNGGPTETHALLTGSVAIDNAGACGLAGDQRDVVRPAGACDTGAYEYVDRILTGFVWRDLNGNGVQNFGEPGMDGITVTLSTGETTTTDHGGYYVFSGLASSTPTITFTLPAGYAFTLQDQGGDEEDSDPDPLTGETIAVDLTGTPPVLEVEWDAGLIPISDLTVTKSNTVGGLVAVTNPWDWLLDVALSSGTSAVFPINSTLLTDTLPAGPTYPATAAVTTTGTVTGTIDCTITANVLTCTATTAVTISPNSGFRVTIAGITAPVGTYTNQAANCTVDPGDVVTEADETNNNCAADDSVTVIDQLGIVKQFTNDPVAPGDTVTLQFTILNPDPANAATLITFTDDLDATLTGLVATGLPLNDICGVGSTLSGTNLITLTGGALAAGDSCTFSVVLQVPAGAALGSYLNTTSNITGEISGAPVVGSPATDTLVVGSSTTSDDDDDDGNGGGQTGSAIALFDPALSKIGFLQPGQIGLRGERIEWQVTVTNTGGAIATNIVITDTIPDGLRIDRISSNVTSSISGQTVTVTIPTLNVGQSITFSIFTTVIDSDLERINIACLTADNNREDICATGTVPLVLPRTGETPWWARWLHRE